MQSSRDVGTQRKEQRCHQEQIGQQKEKGGLRSIHQQDGSQYSSDEAGTNEQIEYTTSLLYQLSSIRPGTSKRSRPERHCTGCICRNRQHTGHNEGRNSKERTPASN